MGVAALLSPTAAFLTGLTYGAACCGPSCGPFFCSYILGTRTGVRQSLKALAIFAIGRLVVLGGVGMTVAWLGTAILASDWRTMAGSMCVAALVGLVGLGLLFGAWREKNESPSGWSSLHCRMSHWLARSNMPVWVVGMLFALVPCPPLVAMMACSSQAQSPWAGAALLMLFGLGSVMSSLLVLTLLTGVFARKINAAAPHMVPWMRRLSGGLLLLLSYGMLTGRHF